MKLIFMGTPDFSVPTLQTLIDSGHEVLAVVTQPDKPRGRSGKMQFSPVKETAVAAGIPVIQPERVKGNAEFYEQMKALAPDAMIVVAFGQILPKEILDLPRYGCINVHASLLPKGRGAAPIQWSVIEGDAQTGVTIMQMDEGIDTGDMLAVRTYTLKEKETGGSLFDTLAQMGGPMVLEVLEQAEQGTLHPVPQDHSAHTYAKMLDKSLGEMDFSKSAAELERLIRGLNPWPSAYTFLEGKMLKIWEADVVESKAQDGPGILIAQDKTSFTIQTGQGGLRVTSVQLAGKKRMDAGSFLRGNALADGTVFGRGNE